jgi:hypothetical protein
MYIDLCRFSVHMDVAEKKEEASHKNMGECHQQGK